MSIGERIALQIRELESHVEQLNSNIEDANSLASKFPDQSLVKARKTVEDIAHRICEELIEDYSEKWPFDRKISELAKRSLIPKLIEANMRNVQKFGNIGAHEGNREEFASHLISPSLESLSFVANWYKEDFLKLGMYKEEVVDSFTTKQLRSGMLLALTGALFWAIGSVITRYGNEIDTNVVLGIATLKYAIGGISVLFAAFIISTINDEKISLKGLFSSIEPAWFLLASACKSINTYCFVAAVSMISAKLAVALENLHLVWIGLIFFFMGNKKVGAYFYLGSLLVVISCILLFPAEEPSLNLYHNRGIVLAVLSGVAFSGFVLSWPRSYQFDSDASSTVVMGALMLLGTLLLFPIHFFLGSFILQDSMSFTLSGTNIFYQIINGIVGIGFTYLLISQATKILADKSYYSSMILSLCLASAVPFTLLLELASFGDTISINNLIGIVVFVLGFVVVKMELIFPRSQRKYSNFPKLNSGG